MVAIKVIFSLLTALIVLYIGVYLATTVFADYLFGTQGSLFGEEEDLFLVSYKDVDMTCSGIPEEGSTIRNYFIKVNEIALSYDYKVVDVMAVFFFKDVTGLGTQLNNEKITLDPDGENTFSLASTVMDSEEGYKLEGKESFILGFFKENEYCKRLAQESEPIHTFMKECGEHIIGSFVLFGECNRIIESVGGLIQINDIAKSDNTCKISFTIWNHYTYTWEEEDNIAVRLKCGDKSIFKKLANVMPLGFEYNPMSLDERTCLIGTVGRIEVYKNCVLGIDGCTNNDYKIIGLKAFECV